MDEKLRRAREKEKLERPKAEWNIRPMVVVIGGLVILAVIVGGTGVTHLMGTEPKFGQAVKPTSRKEVETYKAWLDEGGALAEEARAAAAEQRALEEAERAAIMEREAEEERKKAYIEQYVNFGSIPERDQKEKIAFVVLGDRGSYSGLEEIEGGIKSLYEDRGYYVVTEGFTAAFVGGEFFDQVWEGDASILRRLEVLDRADRFVFIKTSFGEARRGEFEGMLTVDGSLTILSIDGEGKSVMKKNYETQGIGINEEGARGTSAKRLIELVQKEGGRI